MDIPFFRDFFVFNTEMSKPAELQPQMFERDTPVVVIELDSKAAGELLGVSKVKGGNRYETIHLESMCILCSVRRIRSAPCG